MSRLVRGGLIAFACLLALALFAMPADAKKKRTKVLKPATYPGLSRFQCRTDEIPIHPGQNLNDFNVTSVCPHAQRMSGDVDPAVFAAGSTAQGYITRFKPSMVEIKRGGASWSPRASGTSTSTTSSGFCPVRARHSPPARRRRSRRCRRATDRR